MLVKGWRIPLIQFHYPQLRPVKSHFGTSQPVHYPPEYQADRQYQKYLHPVTSCARDVYSLPLSFYLDFGICFCHRVASMEKGIGWRALRMNCGVF